MREGGGCACVSQGLLQAFIDFIVERKVVHLEELASEFGLKVQVGATGRHHHLFTCCC